MFKKNVDSQGTSLFINFTDINEYMHKKTNIKFFKNFFYPKILISVMDFFSQIHDRLPILLMVSMVTFSFITNIFRDMHQN